MIRTFINSKRKATS